MNKFIAVCNLTKDIELRYTPQGKAVCNLGLAINSGYGDKKEVLFINAVAWEKQAENCNTYLSKGKKILLEGKLVQKKYINKEGKEISTFEVLAHNIEFLSPAEKKESPAQAQAEMPIEEQIFIPGEEEMF